MNTPFYIAKRYLFSKKKHHIINIISGISVAGFTVGTMALIIVMSVFNGFEDVVMKLFNTFNPEIQITPKEGKTFLTTTFPQEAIKKIPGVYYFSYSIEENALVKFKDNQFIATIKGVPKDYNQLNGIDSMIVQGDFILEKDSVNFAIVGQGVAYSLGLDMNDYFNPLEIYVPRRESKNLLNPLESFNTEVVYPSGFFSVQQEFDMKYILLPFRFVEKLLNYKQEATSVEIGLAENTKPEQIQKQIQAIVGEDYYVKNRFQQQELLYKIMKSEKWAIILILSFVLLIATFNIIGTLTMLVLEKQKDISILWSMGASARLIRSIFFTEGMLITLIGALMGLFLGGLICWLQQTYGFITMPESGSFVVTAYPIKIKIMDFVYVLFIDLIIGFATSWYPVRQISKNTITQKT